MIQKITAYIVCVEICPQKAQIAAATFILAFDNITFPLSSIYFKFISNEWIIVGYIAIGLTFIFAILSLFVPESPRFLSENQNYSEAKKLLERMSQMNGGDLHTKNWKFQSQAPLADTAATKVTAKEDDQRASLLEAPSNEDELALKKNPFRQMKKDPKLILNLSISTACWIACSFNYFLLSYNIKNLGGNFFLNSSLIAFAGVGGKIITLILRKYVPTKISLITCFTI